MISLKEKEARERYRTAQREALELLRDPVRWQGPALDRLVEEMARIDRWLAANAVNGEGQPPPRNKLVQRPWPGPYHPEAVTLTVRKLSLRELGR